MLDQTEYELALAPRVAGVYNFGNILSVHQVFYNLELLLLAAVDFVLKFSRDNWQIRIVSLCIFFIINGWFGKCCQVSYAPAYDIFASQVPVFVFNVPVFADPDVHCFCNGKGN